MSETEAGENWAEWLQARLDERGWRQADLVRKSEGHIKRDRASKWLKGERPTHRLAIVVANTLNVDRNLALQAAGFTTSLTVPEHIQREHDELDAFFESIEGERWISDAIARQDFRNAIASGDWGHIVEHAPLDVLLAEIERRVQRQPSNVTHAEFGVRGLGQDDDRAVASDPDSEPDSDEHHDQ